MGVFRRKVTKGVPKPVKGHFGDSPEFVNEDTKALKTKPPLKTKRRKVKFGGSV